MLIYHETAGLKEIKHEPFPPAKVGTYIGRTSWHANTDWKLRVKRKTSGKTWKNVSFEQLPTRLKVEALLLGITL